MTTLVGATVEDQLAAEAAGVAFATIVDFEGEKRRRPQYEKVMAIRRALEHAGVVFIPANNGRGFGVRLKDDPRKK